MIRIEKVTSRGPEGPERPLSRIRVSEASGILQRMTLLGISVDSESSRIAAEQKCSLV